MKIALFVFSLVLGLHPLMSSATVLAHYDFEGGSASSDDVDTQSTASSASWGGSWNVGPGGATGSWGLSIGVWGAATIIDSGRYVGFTISPELDQKLNLTTLMFALSGRSASSTPALEYFVRTSADGFASNIGSVLSTANFSSWGTGSVDLTAISFQGLSTPLEVRIYPTETSTTSDFLFLDSITLNGTTTSIPEPGAILLGLLGISTLLRHRRA